MKAFVAFFETHLTYSSFQTSLMTKLTVVRMTNTALLTFFVTDDFLAQETLTKIQNILITDLLLTNAVRFVDPYTLYVRYVMGRKAVNQDHLNMLWEGASWNLGERYTDVFKTLFVTSARRTRLTSRAAPASHRSSAPAVFYSALLPTGYFIAAAYFLVVYWVRCAGPIPPLAASAVP